MLPRIGLARLTLAGLAAAMLIGLLPYSAAVRGQDEEQPAGPQAQPAGQQPLEVLRPVPVGGVRRVPAPAARAEAEASAPGSPASAPDTVVSRRGDRLLGTVLGVGADGRLRLASPQFDGEVKLLAGDLENVELAPTTQSAGRDAVFITNGDSIVGTLTAITADSVLIAADAAGPVKLSRKVVAAISLGKPSANMVDSSFDRGVMEPWKSIRGSNWQLRDGALVCTSRGSQSMVAAPLDQGGPITIEVAFESSDNMRGGNPASMILALFADNTSNSYGSNSVYAMLNYSEVYVGYCQNGSTNNVNNRGMGGNIRGPATLRFAYDPEGHKAKVWLNGSAVGDYDVPQGPAKGKYVMVGSQYSCKIKSIRVTSGISAPEGTGTTKTEADTVQFSNRDHLSAESIVLADGTLTLGTPFGELKSPADKVSGIVFGAKDQEKPRRQKGDVLVQAGPSRFTLQLESLDGDTLSGSSDYLGKVAIKKAAIKSVRFNLYP